MKIAPDLQHRWDLITEKGKPGLIEAIGIRLTRLDHGLVQAEMPVTDTVKQPFGLLHGGASVCLAETVASVGSWMLIDPETQRAAGLEINANHLRAVSGGTIYAEATILHQGKKTHVWQISIRDEQDRPVCARRCTVAILS